jgi:hypothetical protein
MQNGYVPVSGAGSNSSYYGGSSQLPSPATPSNPNDPTVVYAPGAFGGSVSSNSGVTPVNLLGPFGQVSPDNANSITQGQLDSIYGYTPATYGPPASLNSNNTYVNPYLSNSIFDTGADDGE